jgi:hypothetical protein
VKASDSAMNMTSAIAGITPCWWKRSFHHKKGVRYPHCLKGRRACPPEDVGGVWGYENFLEALRDPRHDEHEDYLTWVGGEFDPQAFDLEEVNARLQRMGRGRSTESLSPWSMNEDELTAKRFDLASPWSRTLPDDQRSVAAELPLRRDVVTLLTYLRETRSPAPNLPATCR